MFANVAGDKSSGVGVDIAIAIISVPVSSGIFSFLEIFNLFLELGHLDEALIELGREFSICVHERAIGGSKIGERSSVCRGCHGEILKTFVELGGDGGEICLLGRPTGCKLAFVPVVRLGEISLEVGPGLMSVGAVVPIVDSLVVSIGAFEADIG